MRLASALFTVFVSTFLPAQTPQPSNQAGEVRQFTESGEEGKEANLPGLDFYEAVVRYIQTGGQPERVEVRDWVNPNEPPAIRWFIQTQISPAFTPDTLFTLQEWTNDSAELVVIVPRGGINLWYQLSTPCMTDKPMSVEDAAKRLAYVRIQVTEKEFPEIRRMVNEFKKLNTKTYPLADRLSPDGKRAQVAYLDWTSYSFKAKAPYWSYSIDLGPSDDNPLVSWANTCAESIWKFLKSDKTHGLQAHPLKAIDNRCIGQEILRAQAGAGEVEDVHQLLKLGIPVDSKDYWDESTPLQVAAERYQLEVVRVLLDAGASAKAIREDGSSALHRLPDGLSRQYEDGKHEPSDWGKGQIQRAPNRIQIADLLTKAGAEIDQADNLGSTPLMASVRQRDSLLAAWLLRHGADPKKKDKEGSSAMDRAKQSKDSKLLAVFLENRK